MAASNAIGGFGVTLQRNGTTIAELTKIDPPEFTRNTFEKTTHQSPGHVKEFGKALVEIGEIAIEGNWILTDPTHNAAAGLLGDLSNHTSNDTYTILFPNTASTTWSGPGILTKLKGASPMDAGMTFTATIKCAGQWTIA